MAKPITKAELVAEIATRHSMTKAEANSAVVDATVATIAALVMEEKSVTLPGLAKFEARARPARQVRNVATGEMMDKPADRGVRISALSGIKKRVRPFILPLRP